MLLTRLLPLLLWHNLAPYFGLAMQITVPFKSNSYDLDFVHNFTKHLNRIYRFHSFVTFCENREINRWPGVVVRTLEQALVEDFESPIIVWGLDRTAKLRNHIGLNNMVFVNIVSMDDPMFDVVDRALEGLHFITMLFIYKRLGNAPPTRADIFKFFTWCWSRNIVNVALTFQIVDMRYYENGTFASISFSNQVYNYNPFPRVRVFNLTNLIYTNRGEFVLNKITNVYGYSFTTPIFFDPPTVFLTPFEKHPHHSGEANAAITGTAGRLFHEFIYSINGTINIEFLPNISFYSYHRQTLLLAAKKRIDIGIHPFSGLLQFANQTEGSYPIAQTNACVIVPLVPEMYNGDYLLHTLKPSIWFLVLGALICFFVLDMLSNRRTSLNYDILGSALSYAFNTLLAIPLTSKGFYSRRAREKAFHLYLAGISFIMCNIYSASLTSMLSTTVLGQQINSVEDFLASDLKLMLHNYERNIYFDAGLLPVELRPRLLVTDEQTLIAHRDTLNTSFAYVVTAEIWKMLNVQQGHLWKPRFRIASSDLCTAPFFQKFPLQWDSPFMLSLNLFSMFTHESGLAQRWEDMSIYQAIEMKLFQMIEDNPQLVKPLTVTHFSAALQLYVYMCASAMVCFLCELVWHYGRRFSKRNDRC